jgi:hypothetical protein
MGSPNDSPPVAHKSGLLNNLFGPRLFHLTTLANQASLCPSPALAIRLTGDILATRLGGNHAAESHRNRRCIKG